MGFRNQMIKLFTSRIRHTSVAAAMLLSGFAGCEYGGGAVLVPEVTIVPADFSGDSLESSSSPEAAPSQAATSGASELGSVVGRVVLDGSFEALTPLHSAGADVKDKEVCAKFDTPDERLVLGADNGVANVFVYMQKAPKGTQSLNAADQELIFDQQYCRFLPHCLVVPTGSTVKVLSNDTVAHNTHSYPNKNQGVNSGVAPGDREGKLRITYNRAEAEPIAVKCDYHSWMNAYHLPIDHAFAAVTDKDGNFEISGLPAGEHVFAIWHEAASGKFVERKLAVQVASGDATPIEIKYAVSKLDL